MNDEIPFPDPPAPPTPTGRYQARTEREGVDDVIVISGPDGRYVAEIRYWGDPQHPEDQTRAEGDAVCAPCHAPARYQTRDHHHHAEESAGARCVSCHMPPATYMQIDPRRDHSIRIPRPDRTVTLCTPNACNGCHGDRSPEWAAAQVRIACGNRRFDP